MILFLYFNMVVVYHMIFDYAFLKNRYGVLNLFYLSFLHTVFHPLSRELRGKYCYENLEYFYIDFSVYIYYLLFL